MRDREQGEDRQVMQVLGLNEEAQKSLTLVTEGLHKKYTCVNGKHPVLKFTINTHTHTAQLLHTFSCHSCCCYVQTHKVYSWASRKNTQSF